MQRNLLIVLLAAALPGLAFAQESRSYQCSHGDLERRVEIVSEAGREVPCEVHYYKDTEMPGERQVLWSAQNQAGYCEEKAREFIARLEGFGWNCGAGSPTTPNAVEEPATDDVDMETDDDTDALVPAGDPG